MKSSKKYVWKQETLNIAYMTILTLGVGHKGLEFSPNALITRPGSIRLSYAKRKTQARQRLRTNPKTPLAPSSTPSVQCGCLGGKSRGSGVSSPPFHSHLPLGTISHIFYTAFHIVDLSAWHPVGFQGVCWMIAWRYGWMNKLLLWKINKTMYLECFEQYLKWSRARC